MWCTEYVWGKDFNCWVENTTIYTAFIVFTNNHIYGYIISSSIQHWDRGRAGILITMWQIMKQKLDQIHMTNKGLKKSQIHDSLPLAQSPF